MAERMDMTPQEEFENFAIRLQAAGHEVIPERFAFRHRDFKKDWPDDMVICVREGMEKVPLLNSFGQSVKVSEILPERADLCLDGEGCVLSPEDFRKRYIQYISVTAPDFSGFDLNSEPIPDPTRWVLQIVDPFSESSGAVEVGYDARKPAEEERTHDYDPERDQLVERIAAKQDEQSEAVATALTALKDIMEKQKNEPPKRGPGRPPKNAA